MNKLPMKNVENTLSTLNLIYLPLAHTRELRGHNPKLISKNASLLTNMLFLKKLKSTTP